MKMMYNKKSNLGFSLLELIIVVAVIGILTGILVPQYLKYVTKSRKAMDIRNGEVIGRAFELAFLFNDASQEIYDNWSGVRMNNLKVTVDGKEEKYDVYLVLSSETNGYFTGTEQKFKKDLGNGMCFYDIINEELGISYNKNGTVNKNIKNNNMIPRFTGVGPDGKTKIDRWRVVKRISDGRIEVWSAYDLHDGKSYGGKPCYRVYPQPDDVYTKN